MKQYYVYLATNESNSVLYIGVTNNLVRRIFEHKNKFVSSFTQRYNITKLVYYEIFEDINSAIAREKQLKAGSRAKKIMLIEMNNSAYKDLYDDIIA